jgi:hypothetical protein
VANALETPVTCLFTKEVKCPAHSVLARPPRPFSDTVDLSGQRFHPHCGIPLSLSHQITDNRLNKCYA